MAIFRKVHTSIWSDSFFSELTKDKKLFYLYLLTNEKTKQCGVYEITKRQISFDLGYSINTVSILLKYFINTGKIRYNNDTKEIGLGNWLKYNSSVSPKMQSCINKEFSLVKDTLLIEYVKSMDTHSQQEEEQEEEKEEEKTQNNIPELFDFLEYGRTVKIYHSSFDFQIENKYKSWVQNGWKDGNGKKINNWKLKLNSTMPYFKKDFSQIEKQDYTQDVLSK